VATVSGAITDPGILDTFTVTIDWGEGSPESFSYPAESTSYSETHPYLDDNPTGTGSDTYAIGVTVTDNDTGSGSASSTVTVNNVAPSVIAGADAAINEGDTFSGAGSFTDPGADTWTATVNYGDGSGTSPLALSGMGFSLSHVYAPTTELTR
jgi:hypothetical protein